ncbi:MAG TPA: VWA domain-containing protein, partial [Pyrinomonadaceae bacterium]|nr:VWA domain-containing protein [Pyrinomonadaceae bacterium]
RRQRDPGLLEYAGKDLLQASIFPIPPNSDKKIELTYSQVLKADSGTVSYRYPLGTGRNVWSRPGPQIENVRRNMPEQTFGTVSGNVEIVAKDAIRNVYSPSHKIDVKNFGENRASISFETNKNDNDFQLFYGLSDDDFGLSLLTYREPGKDGYFLLTLSPKDDISESELVNKDIVFVLDTSGSMAEEGKIDKARSALLFGIRSLREGDRFNVVNFAGEEHLMDSGLISADASGKRRGEEFVRKLQPTGGTNINDSLTAALKQFQNNDRPKMLVFMTDGLPTVGITDTERIIANVRGAKKIDIRIFPFGFGYDVNTALLDKLGSENSGMSDYVQPKEDLEVKVSSFFSRVSSPVLSDLDLNLGGAETEFVYPRKLTDLFRGTQLTLIGRYKNDRDLIGLTATLRGKTGNTSRSFNFRNLDFPLRNDDNGFLPRLWASRRVGWLIEQIRLNGETKEVKDEIVELGTRYGIVTPYTSYLAADGNFAAVQQETERFRAIAKDAPAKMAMKSGAGAVQQSVQQNTMQMNSSVAADEVKGEQQVLIRNTAANQFVANKNFFNQGNTWIDSEFSADSRLPEINLKFGSDEYFKLALNDRRLAQYFALGEEVVVVWNGKIYRVTK